MFNVHQLNVFTTAAECLNFTTTARTLHMTQSSVSQHIKNLETQIEMKLFYRKGRTIELTDTGKYFLPLARAIVVDTIRAQEKMQLLKEQVYGELVIGCNTAPGKYILPLLLSEFRNRYPLVHVTCTVLPNQQILDFLNQGDVHFALINLDSEIQTEIEHQLFMREPIWLIAPVDHPWAIAGSISPEELYDGNFILRDVNSGSYQSVQHGLSEVGIDINRLQAGMVMGTSEALALAVQADLGVGFVSETIVSKICRDQVAHVLVQGLEICQEIYMARQIRKPATSAQTAFWDFLRTTYSVQSVAFSHEIS